MNASNECPDCPPLRDYRGLPLAVVLLAIVGAGIALPEGRAPTADTKAGLTCDAIRAADPGIGVYYDDTRDVCHVWDGWAWRPVITNEPDKR
jgi:hypothetical protein